MLMQPRKFTALPPEPVLQSLINCYFLHVYNQPYSYFSEESFRMKLAAGLIPKCLIFAILATAVRFSDHEYYIGRFREARETYAREAWLSVLHDHLISEDSPSLSVVQTTNTLAIIDFTGQCHITH